MVECNLNVYDAVTADEAFFTSTAFTLMPCIKVNGSQLGDGTIGPVAKKLVEAWNDLVGLDFIAQAKAYLEEMRQEA